MNKLKEKLIYTAVAAMMATPSFATITKFMLTPTTPVALSIPANATALVQYRVTNQSLITRQLTMVPMQGVVQKTDQDGYCSNPFTLGSQQSCLLTLELNGSQLPAAFSGGPRVCKTVSNSSNRPDNALCSQPETSSMLSARVIGSVSGNSQAVYVTNWNANSISLCYANAATGMLENCNIAAIGGTLLNPEAITINNAMTYMYVANIGGSVSLCNVDSQNGALSGCHTTGSGFAGPDGVVLNPSNTLAYVSNSTNDKVSLCQVDANTGELSGCSLTGSGFSVPSDIALDPAGSFAYVGNFTGNSVSSCQVNGGTGALENCVTTSGFPGPEGVMVNPAGTYAYITNNLSNDVSLCSFTAGVLSGCSSTGVTFDGFGNLALNSTGTLAWVPSTGSKVLLCQVDAGSGALSSCVDSGGTGFSSPSGVLATTLSGS